MLATRTHALELGANRWLVVALPLLGLACSPGDPVQSGSFGGQSGVTSGGAGAAQAGTMATSGGGTGLGGAGTFGAGGALGTGGTVGTASGGATVAGGMGTGGALASGGESALGGMNAVGGTSVGSGGMVMVDPCATVTCGQGQTCSNGTCMCTTGTLCSSKCVDVQEDQENCGGCGMKCSSDGACVSGKCVTPMCNPDTMSRSGHITTYQLATKMVACHWETSTLPQHYGAMNEYDWNNSAVCGACVEVTNTQNNSKLTVQIVDQCPYQGNEKWCFQGSHHIDLNGAAYGALGANNNPAVNWKFVPCSPMGNIKYYFDSSSQQYYLAVSPQNYKNPIAKVEVKKAGAYVALTRSTYNMFEASMGAGTGDLTFRLTDIYNHVLTDTVAMTPGKTVTGNVQFPACP